MVLFDYIQNFYCFEIHINILFIVPKTEGKRTRAHGEINKNTDISLQRTRLRPRLEQNSRQGFLFMKIF